MRLTEYMIFARTKLSNLSTIKRINLWGCDLTDISIVEDMPNVEVLALSLNKLSCLQAIAACAKLQVLYLRNNNINDFQELKHLQNLPDLKELWLCENPCAVNAGSNYRATVVKMLPNLKKLDNEDITSADIEASMKSNCTNAESKLLELDIQPEKVSPQSKLVVPPTELKKPEPHDADLIELELEQQIEDINSKQKVTVVDLPPEITQPLQPQQPQHEQPYIMQQRRKSMQSIPAAVEAIKTQRSRLSLPANINPMISVTESQEEVTQIPQLKVVLQIQQPQPQPQLQPQPQQDQPIGIQYPEWNKPRVSLNENYDTFSDSAAHKVKTYHSAKVQQGSRSSRTRVSQGLNNDSGWDSYSSRTEQENKPQRTHQYEGIQASNRAAHINENLNWGDGLNSNRSCASRTTSSSSTMNTPRSSRRNANVFSALLCVVPELDLDSLQVLEHSVQCRLDELSNL